MSAEHPTTARVTSLTHWTHLFHPQTGVFRLPHTTGVPIEHLDIDLRFVEHDPTDTQLTKAQAVLIHAQIEDIYLPNVVKLTLRGAEHVHDSEERMECLAEILCAINPVEVQWLNAAEDPNEMLTFSTHMVHPAVIAAGERWTRMGSLRKLVIQGGFPCPNLTAPTPFSLTPAATPASSPGPHKTTFGSFMSMGGLTGLPALSTIKPKPIDETKAKERAERKRLAEYSLKPRFQYAFGTWGVDEVRWRLDGRYTSVCILAIMENLLNALDKTYLYSSLKVDVDLPSLFAFTCIPTNIIDKLQSLQTKLDLHSDFVEYLEDCLLVSTPSHPMNYTRIFSSTSASGDDKETEHSGERKARRMKAEVTLLQEKGLKIVDPAYLTEEEHHNAGMETDLESSMASLSHEKESSGEEDQAVTPELGNEGFIVFEDVQAADLKEGKGSRRGTGDWTEEVGQGPIASRH